MPSYSEACQYPGPFGAQMPVWVARTWLWSLMKTDVKSCTVTGPARTKAPDAQATAQGPSGNQALKWVAEAEPSDLFAFKECQDLFRTQLTGPLLRLIPQLTGLRLHVLWHRPFDFQGLGAMGSEERRVGEE